MTDLNASPHTVVNSRLMEFRRRMTFFVGLLCALPVIPAKAAPPSHPPMRPLPTASNRALASGPAYFVDTLKGSDQNDGSRKTPWKSLQIALPNLSPGDTLYLRGGTYYERIYCSLAGLANKPITIRSYPGELAIIDGGWEEFHNAPAKAWQPFASGAAGEFRSTRSFRNERNVHGRFADSLVGLQVYYHIDDLRGERYVGPGIWYDRASGHIHIRLAHYNKTGLIRGRTPLTLKNFPHRLHHLESYRGPTDPRQLPLIISPFRSTSLLIDRAQHLRIQDIVVRGAGFTTVDIRHAEHLELDNVTIYAAAYGLKARNTGPLKMINSAIYGSVPPWSTRAETSLKERPWESKGKNLTRLNTHALIIPAAGDEYSVYYFPYNHQWEIANCEFADAHDGVYMGDIDGLKFHHNYLHNFQDDGVYLSSFRKLYEPQHGPRMFYQNVISGCLMAFAFGGDARLSSDVHVLRNLLDASTAVADHGSPPWESMRWYNNTVFANPRSLLSSRTGGRPWVVMNNLLLVGKNTAGKPQDGAVWSGNLAGDPQFKGAGDFRIHSSSPAIDAGAPIPSEWFDPLGNSDEGAPDVGALPAGSDRLRVGRRGRLAF